MFFPASPTKQTRRRGVAEEKKTGETICRDGEPPAGGSDNFSGARGDGSAFRRVLQMAAEGAGRGVEQSSGGAAGAPGRGGRGGAEGRRVQRFREQVRLDDRAFAEHDGALDDVLELADVPRPVVSQQAAHGRGRDVADGLVVARGG